MDKKSILSKFISTQGYKRNSPDVNNPINVIPSNQITMENVDFPIVGVDNLGNKIVMHPGKNYTFPGDYVIERKLQEGGESTLNKFTNLWKTYKDKDASVDFKTYDEAKNIYFDLLLKQGKREKLDKSDLKLLNDSHQIMLSNMKYYEPGGKNTMLPIIDAGSQIKNTSRAIFNDIFNTNYQEGGDVIRSTTDVAKRNDVLFRFLQMNQLDRDKLAKRSDVEIDNMEKYEQSVEGWMKYQDDVAEEKRRQYYEPIDRIKRTWFDEKPYQDGGSTQEQEIQQLLQQIAEQIGQGVEPEAIVQQLVESGVSQEQAIMIVQKAMETSQQEQLPIAQNGMEYATQHNYLSNLDYGDFKQAGKDWSTMWKNADWNNPLAPFSGKDFGQAMKSTFTPENINTAALATNSLTGYYSPVHALPNTGLLGKIKAGIGLASGLSGALLGWEKVFAKDKSYLTDESKQMVGDKLQAALKTNSTITSPLQTNENKTAAENINSITNPYQNWVNKNRPAYNGPLEAYIEDNEKINNITPPYMNEAPIKSYWQTGGELPTAQLGIPSDFSDEIGTPYPSWYIDSYITPNNNNISSRLIFNQNNTASKNNEQVISRGDPLGFVTAMNAVAGLGIFNDVMSQTDIQKQYEEMLRRTGNTDNRFVAQNPNNPFGTYTPNAPMASNFMNVRNGYTQNIGTGTMSAKCGGTKKFKDGGVYTITEEEMKDLLAQGYDIEFLD